MSNTSNTVQLIVTASKYISYINSIIPIIGLIGNSLNILVLTKLKLFRSNRASLYLIVESIVNISLLFAILIPQLILLVNGNDPANLSLIWCKIRTSIAQPYRLLAGSIICFEAFDQFLSTHHHVYIQQLSTFKLARHLIWITYSVWFLQSIPYIIFYDIVPGSGCTITNQGLVNYYSYVYYIFLNGLLPIVTSTCFSLLAYRNVRRLVQRRIPLQRRRLDHQMTAMIFTRVIVFIICLTPYTIFRIYILHINIPSTDLLGRAINQFISSIVTSLLIWVYSVEFFIQVFKCISLLF